MSLTHAARDARRRVIRERLQSGESVESLATEYGLTAAYVYIIGKGIARSSRTVAAARRLAQLREFHSLDQTQAAFVKITGLHPVRVSQMARKLGLKFRKDTTGWRRVRDESARRTKSMAALYRAGYTLAQIGDQYGLSRERVRQLLGKYESMSGADGGASAKAAARAEKQKAARDARCMVRFGCSFETYNAVPSKAKRAFCQQRASAARRKVGWELTLWQWWSVWQESGHWRERGRGQGYVMCRKGDEGPYAVGNVFIATAIENSSVAKHKKSDLPTGVSARASGRFSAHRMIGGKTRRLGTFDTPSLAHAAYLMAGHQPPTPLGGK